MRLKTSTWLAAVALAAVSGLASAQTVKIGIITTYSGPGSAQGDQLDKGFKLYLKLNGNKLPPGVKVEPIYRDDTGANADAAKRLAQELIARDKVQFLTGVVWTPNAAAIAPLTAEARVPFVSANAAGVAIPRISPYFARVSFTLWQSSYPLGQWAAKKFKRIYTVVSDFSPGHEAEEAFTKGFKDAGGEIVGSARVPMTATDFIPYIGTGDITTDEELQNMGDVALGVMTVHHYSAAANRPANKAFVAAYKKEYGEKLNPGFMVLGAWDAMDMIFHAIREQKGKIDPDKTMQIFRNYKNPNSPRGPIQIDPENRDIIQNEYLMEVRKVVGTLANVQLETLATQYKDPWKEFNKPK